MEQPNLHDATLIDITLRWGKQAALEVRFRDCGPRIVTLRIGDVTLLHCPHDNPWGPSVSVNEVRVAVTPPEAPLRIEIEVQSGDTVVMEGRSMAWEIDDEPKE